MQINLLPWREQLRETQKKHFLQILSSGLLLAGTAIFLLHLLITHQIKNQEQHNAQLQQSLQALANKIQEVTSLQQQQQQLAAQRLLLQQIKDGRRLTEHLCGDLARAIPSGVLLSTIKRVGAQIIVSGKAENSAQVALFLRNLAASNRLNWPVLRELKTVPLQDGYDKEFILEIKII
jgi:type IV pilus assembly protein PilN